MQNGRVEGCPAGCPCLLPVSGPPAARTHLCCSTCAPSSAGGFYIQNNTDFTTSAVGWVQGNNLRLLSGAGTDQFSIVEGTPPTGLLCFVATHTSCAQSIRLAADLTGLPNTHTGSKPHAAARAVRPQAHPSPPQRPAQSLPRSAPPLVKKQAHTRAGSVAQTTLVPTTP